MRPVYVRTKNLVIDSRRVVAVSSANRGPGHCRDTRVWLDDGRDVPIDEACATQLMDYLEAEPLPGRKLSAPAPAERPPPAAPRRRSKSRTRPRR